MRQTLAWICAVIATLLAVAIVFWFGVSPLTILIALLLLACPVLVIWMSLRLSRQCERDIRQAIERERKSRGKC
ncbi:hypothetical protein LMG23994_05300 [Cupriavidus pinatubonensis]|jgi:hypothetical protein|uniref:Transmembrane protein n=1 Tax=Cupriavidus pinatubonensis TaxID=248026 RepID=A0ABM8XUK5_9BURK|nr:hypothetical protein LMG23994_05300 [Cupriavidus pinatubonensis]